MERGKRILIISICCFLSTLIFAFIGFNGIFRFVVRDQTALKRRNMIRKFYLKLPMGLDFRVYFFNVSNPEQVLQGKKPIVKEIGPYGYDTYKEKIEVNDNDGEDTLTYTPWESYYFNPGKSGEGLREDDYVTILNPIVVGMVNYVLAQDMVSIMPLVNKALKNMLGDPTSIYFTVKVRDILWSGLTINCTSKDYIAKALCPQMRVLLSNYMWEEPRNIIHFSLFGRRNGTHPLRLKVLRGIKKSKDLGRVVEINEEKQLKIWNGKCNKFRGTDSWIFPPFLTKEEGIWVYSTDMCRSLQAQYIEETSFHGIATRKYIATLGDMSEPDQKCYCASPNSCMPKGVINLSKCLGVPIYATLPHFAEADPKYLKKVIGLKPETEKHVILLNFEYMTGVPVEGYKRLQVNLPVKSFSRISFMKTLPDCLHPILWIEESVQLSGSLLMQMSLIFIALKVFNVAKYIFLLLSLSGMGYGGYLFYKNKNGPTITPVHSAVSSTSTIKSDFSTIKSKTSSKYEPTIVGHTMSSQEFDKY